MKPLILALDVETEREALSLIKQTSNSVDVVKVGPPLLLKYGPSIFKKITAHKKKIFLDLKFHDIPNTMLRSVKEASRNDIFSLTIHTSAGLTAMRTIAQSKTQTKIWGVTVLTSFSEAEFKGIGFKNNVKEQVLHLTALAKAAKIDGIVASVEETNLLRKKLGPTFTIVTPGIRLPTNDVGDQKRVATPSVARKAGATFIVVGRPIIESNNPRKMAETLMSDWNSND